MLSLPIYKTNSHSQTKSHRRLYSLVLFYKFSQTQKNSVMKKVALLSIVLLLGSIFIYSCQQDLGNLNSASAIENIKGTWHVVRNEGDLSSDYQVEITENSQVDNGIIIHNFNNDGEDAHATVKDNEITLPSQKLGTNTVQATGIISDDYQRIDWNITIDGDHVTATFTPGTVAKKLAR